VKFRDRIPPGLVTLVIVYGLFLGFLAAIRYFDLSDYFFSQAGRELAIVAVIFGAVQVLICFIICFRPDWADHFKNDDNFVE
jgi:hypothetical protein